MWQMLCLIKWCMVFLPWGAQHSHTWLWLAVGHQGIHWGWNVATWEVCWSSLSHSLSVKWRKAPKQQYCQSLKALILNAKFITTINPQCKNEYICFRPIVGVLRKRSNSELFNGLTSFLYFHLALRNYEPNEWEGCQFAVYLHAIVAIWVKWWYNYT